MQDRLYIVSSFLKDEKTKTEVEAILCDVTHQDVTMIVQRLGTVTKGVGSYSIPFMFYNAYI